MLCVYSMVNVKVITLVKQTRKIPLRICLNLMYVKIVHVSTASTFKRCTKHSKSQPAVHVAPPHPRTKEKHEEGGGCGYCT